MKPVVFLNSHPIQYFAPLYQQIATETTIDLEILYCSNESIRGLLDREFGTAVKWDIPLLTGYSSVFLKNNSWRPSIHKGFFGVINWGVIRYLYKKPKSVIIIHGWKHFTFVLTIIAAKLLGHTVCLRAETPLNQEKQKNKTVTALKHVYLRFLFLFIDRFLYVGLQNKLFYQALGVVNSRLIFAPYCVDNKRFRNIFTSKTKAEARQELQLAGTEKVILYSGKYIQKKRPLDLLKAFALLQNETIKLVMVGDGELRGEMEAFIAAYALTGKVVLTGFINQSVIPLYYRAADVFVMCSELGETWGLSVNEAMNFGLPIIVSDTCGSSYDLVKNGVNGQVFETGNTAQLSKFLAEYLDKSEEEILRIQRSSFDIIDHYSYEQVINALHTVASS